MQVIAPAWRSHGVSDLQDMVGRVSETTRGNGKPELGSRPGLSVGRSRIECSQPRTGMVRINSYLHNIGAAETMEHFLFRCTKWDAQRVGHPGVWATSAASCFFRV